MCIGDAINYVYIYIYLPILYYVDDDGTGRSASFYGHFNGHRTMHSQHRDHWSIAKAQGNNRCPGSWLLRLSATTTSAERSARIFFSCFFAFWWVVLCVVLCFCGLKKQFINRYPLFNTRKPRPSFKLCIEVAHQYCRA